MLSRLNGAVWMEDGAGDENTDGVSAVSWSTTANQSPGGGMGDGKDGMGLPSFKSLLDDDWYMNPAGGSGSGDSDLGATAHQGFGSLHSHQDMKEVAFPSDSCPADASVLLPSSVFNLELTSQQPFFSSKSALPSLLNSISSNPFAGFDLGSESSGFLAPTQMPNSSVLMNRASSAGGGRGVFGFAGLGASGQMGGQDLSPNPRLLTLAGSGSGSGSGTGTRFNPLGIEGFENSSFPNRPKVLRPLEIFPPIGAQPNLFQKRAAAALRQNTVTGGEDGSGFGFGFFGSEAGVQEKRRRGNEEDEMDDGSIDGSGLNYDSDEFGGENGKEEEEGKNGGGNGSNTNSTVTGGGDQKGKKKGLPAKNLMAERRRRKKLNDRLYMLRSVVPKISKVKPLV